MWGGKLQLINFYRMVSHLYSIIIELHCTIRANEIWRLIKNNSHLPCNLLCWPCVVRWMHWQSNPCLGKNPFHTTRQPCRNGLEWALNCSSFFCRGEIGWFNLIHQMKTGLFHELRCPGKIGCNHMKNLGRNAKFCSRENRTERVCSWYEQITCEVIQQAATQSPGQLAAGHWEKNAEVTK